MKTGQMTYKSYARRLYCEGKDKKILLKALELLIAGIVQILVAIIAKMIG
jgi:hypothetical protein